MIPGTEVGKHQLQESVAIIDLWWCRTRKQNLLDKRTERICQKRRKGQTNIRDE